MGLSVLEGYSKGIETLEKIIHWLSKETEIKYLTIYALSAENVCREDSELDILYGLYSDAFKKAANSKEIHENKVRISVIGDYSGLPQSVKDSVHEVIEKTKDYQEKEVVMAFGYSGRNEIIDATKKIVMQVQVGELDPANINEQLFSESLYLSHLPDPDLIIRTAEKRLSNFLTWQSAYSELCFINKLFPELTIRDLENAVEDFEIRERRYGR